MKHDSRTGFIKAFQVTVNGYAVARIPSFCVLNPVLVMVSEMVLCNDLFEKSGLNVI